MLILEEVPARHPGRDRLRDHRWYWCVVALFAPYIAPRPDEAFDSNILMRLKPPSADYPFGTDSLGRDILTRVILGTRSALLAASRRGVRRDAYRRAARPLSPATRADRVSETSSCGSRTSFSRCRSLSWRWRMAQILSRRDRERDAGPGADLLAVLHPHRLLRDPAGAEAPCSSTRSRASAQAGSASWPCTSCPMSPRRSSFAPRPAWGSRS